MSLETPPQETLTENKSSRRIPTGLVISFAGLLIMILGAKPAWFGLDRSLVVGFVQIIVFLIGLAFVCLGGYLGLGSLWGKTEKSILADIGIRLVSTGYVITLFSGLADVFGMTVQNSSKQPFFGPWQEAGMEVGMLIIAAGMLMIIPYRRFKKAQ
ncbi:MAG TPA: hypothetical protein VGK00_00470 [Anaerolineales bacterium]|jgi:hypothetical protein